MRAMKHLLALAIPLLFSGCAMDVSPDEHDFIYRGWTHPEQAAQERMYGGKHGTPNPDETQRHPVPDSPNSNAESRRFAR